MFNYSRSGDEGRGALEDQKGREEGAQGGPDDGDGVPPDGPTHRLGVRRGLASVDDVAVHEQRPDDERPPRVHGLHRDPDLVPHGEELGDGHRSDLRADQRGHQGGAGASCYFTRLQRHPLGDLPGADLQQDQESAAEDAGPAAATSIPSGPRRGDGIRAQVQEGPGLSAGPAEDQPSRDSRGDVEGRDEVWRAPIRRHRTGLPRPALHADGSDQPNLRRTLPPASLRREPGFHLQRCGRLHRQAHRARRPRRDRAAALLRRSMDRSGEGIRKVQGGARTRQLAAAAGSQGAVPQRHQLGVMEYSFHVQTAPRPPPPSRHQTKGRGEKAEPRTGTEQRPRIRPGSRIRKRIRPRRTTGRSTGRKADKWRKSGEPEQYHHPRRPPARPRYTHPAAPPGKRTPRPPQLNN